jgi:hypothetical protein
VIREWPRPGYVPGRESAFRASLLIDHEEIRTREYHVKGLMSVRPGAESMPVSRLTVLPGVDTACLQLRHAFNAYPMNGGLLVDLGGATRSSLRVVHLDVAVRRRIGRPSHAAHFGLVFEQPLHGVRRAMYVTLTVGAEGVRTRALSEAEWLSVAQA